MCAPGPAPCAVRARRRAGGAAGCGSTHTPPQGPPAGRRPARRARPRVSRDPPARGNTKDYDDKTQERPRTNKRGLEVSHHRHRAKRWPLVSTTSVHTSQTPRNRKPPRPSKRAPSGHTHNCASSNSAAVAQRCSPAPYRGDASGFRRHGHHRVRNQKSWCMCPLGARLLGGLRGV